MSQHLDIAGAFARLASIPKVYPLYLASRAKAGLLKAFADQENIIASVGDIETIGDCKYRIGVTDHNGTKYKITVEVAA